MTSQLTPGNIFEHMTIGEIRKEYSQLRSIANKRLNRLRNSEFSNSQAALKYDRNFPTLANIRNDREVVYQLFDVQDFLSLKTSTITGARQAQTNTLKSLQERGFTNITRANLREFGQFMNRFKDLNLSYLLDSDQVAEFFETGFPTMGIDKLNEAFDTWVSREVKYQRRGRKESIQRGSDFFADLFKN